VLTALKEFREVYLNIKGERILQGYSLSGEALLIFNFL
jgi:hypothetical protein